MLHARQSLLSKARQLFQREGLAWMLSGVGSRVALISLGGAVFLGSFELVYQEIEAVQALGGR